MSSGRRVTLKDIAARAETSTMAVSVVLNGARSNTRVSDSTRRRIQDAAAGMNYTPNALARSLKRQRTNTLGVLFNWAGSRAIHNLYSVSVLDGIVTGAEKAGYHVLLYTEGWRNAAESSASFGGQRADGVIVIAPDENSDVVPGLIGLGLPVVLASSATTVEGVPYVTLDNQKGVRLALDHLYELGHRRIAYAGHGGVRHTPRLRYATYREWMNEKGLPTPPDADTLADMRPNGEGAALNALLNQATPLRPTAVLAFNDDLAVQALEQARGLGLSLPGDLSVVGFDDILLASLTIPKLTTVRQPLFEMGEKAVERLVARIEGTEADALPAACIMEAKLVVRDSTAPPRPA